MGAQDVPDPRRSQEMYSDFFFVDESWKGTVCRTPPAIGLFLDPKIV
jgi:hypothetical protein